MTDSKQETAPSPTAARPLRHPDLCLVETQVRAALEEDVGSGDLTAALLPRAQRSRAELITREPAVVCGCAWFDAAFRLLDPDIAVRWEVADGDRVSPGQRLALIDGPSAGLLTGERTAMNYLQTLSGTATRAAGFAAAVAGLPVQVLDTRKTLPGLRVQQKYAVLCGGCHNQRMGLFDAILIKENHILAAGSIPAALKAASAAAGAGVEIQIEVESLDDLQTALDGGAESILLDNFALGDLRLAVAMSGGRARLEASGGVTLATIRAIAETGVDRISVGALTKDVAAVDLSMRFMG
ncbi:carboxylating nicotinate-nucleotide diphosphorylase [Thiocapsa bogorovii]|uniref:carboxylating nicotinate-nucleotide diphosphorylase n=1 Tax=Thiocapsa bogorovii TaxID=521689 RepID=UPI001E45CFCD|nr:carboxylating nicotinate-nucleotide diphosphorylase [Thiocapsa bogorovii]UHD18220.1 carboxylating nicotinate-nucleotide diphosphorylase [Thiocapsa bogorovii]